MGSIDELSVPVEEIQVWPLARELVTPIDSISRIYPTRRGMSLFAKSLQSLILFLFLVLLAGCAGQDIVTVKSLSDKQSVSTAAGEGPERAHQGPAF